MEEGTLVVIADDLKPNLELLFEYIKTRPTSISCLNTITLQTRDIFNQHRTEIDNEFHRNKKINFGPKL